MTNRQPYETDLTDEQWELIKDLLPPRKRLGRKRTIEFREMEKGEKSNIGRKATDRTKGTGALYWRKGYAHALCATAAPREPKIHLHAVEVLFFTSR